MATKPWRDVNAIYQIYPRSFMDSNSDGVGDLRGVISRLEYLKSNKDSLGIDAIWFSPFYPSPMIDMGYDVADYCDIDPIFGTLTDFKELLAKAHELEINVMIDLVPNHTSDQHQWFKESRKSKDNDKSDYYVWRDPKLNGGPPNNWISVFGGSAWEYDEVRGQYYLHSFLKQQPDLNWDNPMVRDEMKRVVRFWMDMGVDGMRVDAVRYISKDQKFRDNPPNKYWLDDKKTINKFHSQLHKYSEYQSTLFPYLREMTDIIEQYDDRIMIFEDYPDWNYSTRDQYLGFYSINPKVSMPFNFEGLSDAFEAEYYQTMVSNFQGMLDPDQHVPVYCFSNHDKSRIVSRLGGEEQARLIALMQFTLPGLPVVYYGDELGMPDTPIPYEFSRDMSVATSGESRDPERTPMQWEHGQYAGFSGAKPWLPVGESVSKHNVDKQMGEPDSHLSLYRRMLRLRSHYEILRRGTFEALADAPKEVFLFSRWLDDQHVFVALNFSKKPQTVKLPHNGRVLCCTHPVDYPDIVDDGVVLLRPYEGVLVECREHPVIKDKD